MKKFSDKREVYILLVISFIFLVLAGITTGCQPQVVEVEVTRIHDAPLPEEPSSFVVNTEVVNKGGWSCIVIDFGDRVETFCELRGE